MKWVFLHFWSVVKQHGTVACSMVAVALLSGCMSPPRHSKVPEFTHRTRTPVAIRLTDSRPEVERGNVPDRNWIYFQLEGSQQADLLVDYLGNALLSLNAAPRIIVLEPKEVPLSSRVMIEIDYKRGYSRWPRNFDQLGTTIPVQAAIQIDYQLTIDGILVLQKTLQEVPADFLIPASVLTEKNIRRIVSESLGHQFNKATTGLLDDMMWQMESAWPTGP